MLQDAGTYGADDLITNKINSLLTLQIDCFNRYLAILIWLIVNTRDLMAQIDGRIRRLLHILSQFFNHWCHYMRVASLIGHKYVVTAKVFLVGILDDILC